MCIKEEKKLEDCEDEEIMCIKTIFSEAGVDGKIINKKIKTLFNKTKSGEWGVSLIKINFNLVQVSVRKENGETTSFSLKDW